MLFKGLDDSITGARVQFLGMTILDMTIFVSTGKSSNPLMAGPLTVQGPYLLDQVQHLRTMSAREADNGITSHPGDGSKRR